MMTGHNYSKVINHKAGWYRGDFHTHTHASDGVYPPDILAGVAKAEGLDFIAITDHNTIAGIEELSEHLDFLVIPGLEISFHKGHFNVFGTQVRGDWMEPLCSEALEIPLPKRYKSINDLLQETKAAGLINSINHPLLPPWAWEFAETDLGLVHCLELWNDLYWPGNDTANPATAEMWTKWLNAGHRITAIGGSDYHYPPRPEENKPGERLGMPTTCVYAKELSTAGILDALRMRRAYVTKGPQFDFSAEADGLTFKMGADLGELSGEIKFMVSIPYQPKSIHLQLLKNGVVIAEEQTKGRDITAQFHHKVNGNSPEWFRLDVRDKDGDLLAVTNPFFTGPRNPPKTYQYQELMP